MSDCNVLNTGASLNINMSGFEFIDPSELEDAVWDNMSPLDSTTDTALIAAGAALFDALGDNDIAAGEIGVGASPIDTAAASVIAAANGAYSGAVNAFINAVNNHNDKEAGEIGKVYAENAVRSIGAPLDYYKKFVKDLFGSDDVHPAQIEHKKLLRNMNIVAVSSTAGFRVPTSPRGGTAGTSSSIDLARYGGEWTGGELIIQADCAKLKNVRVDDSELVKDRDYRVKCGSTIITFTPAYLATLKDGTHTVRVQFTDGFYMGAFDTPLGMALTASVADVPATGGAPLYAQLLLLAAGMLALRRKITNAS